MIHTDAEMGLTSGELVKVVTDGYEERFRAVFDDGVTAANIARVLVAFEVDEIVDSRWTLTVLGAQLRMAGSGPTFPLALADTGPKSTMYQGRKKATRKRTAPPPTNQSLGLSLLKSTTHSFVRSPGRADGTAAPEARRAMVGRRVASPGRGRLRRRRRVAPRSFA